MKVAIHFLDPAQLGLDTTRFEAAGIVGIGVVLGLVGSWLTAARHMRRIEPR